MITVAIPTLGRPAYALAALHSVISQVSDIPAEVLILDNGCDTALEHSVRQVAEGARLSVEYVAVPGVGLHVGRHAAARRAEGDVLAYLDDDVLVEPGWLAALASAFADPNVHLVGGRCLPLYDSDRPQWLEAFWTRGDDGTRWCESLSLIDPGPDARDINPLFIFGANFAIRKETLVRIGGFHPDALPWDLRRFRGDGETAVSVAANKLGLRAVYSPEATVHHRVPKERMTEEYFERRAFLAGISDSFSAARSKGDDTQGQPHSGWSHRLAHRIRTAARTFREQVPRDWEARRTRAAEAHAAGYAYHQDQMRTSPAVRAWVSRRDYWDATLPDSGDT